MAIIAGSGPILDQVAYAALSAINSDPIVSRGNRSRGLTIWALATTTGDYQLQVYMPSGAETAEEFLDAQWQDHGAPVAIVANTLNKLNEVGGFIAVRIVFTPTAQPGVILAIASFYGGGA